MTGRFGGAVRLYQDEMYLRDIDPPVMFNLHNLLDSAPGFRNGWKHLAAVIGLSLNEVNKFEAWEKRGESPTENMLKQWDYSNVTPTQLYLKLYEMRHAEAMKLIKNYVEPEHHRLIDEIVNRGEDS